MDSGNWGTDTGRMSAKEPLIANAPRGLEATGPEHAKKAPANVKVEPYFADKHAPFTSDRPFDAFTTVEWETRSAEIKNPNTGETVFAEKDLQFPKTWSQNCVAMVAEKYFRTIEHPATNATPESTKSSFHRETSVREMINRVAGTIAKWGRELHYFATDDQASVFREELKYILLHQMAAFNSPVWFNVGTKHGAHRQEQCSACFINSVQDNMQSILGLADTEGRLYKGGSGSGVNYSALRSSREKLSGGGFASGPVPFIAKDDFNAGAIKSGGTTRRAAKMAILDVDHGDILEFINCKSNSEKAAHLLIDGGVDGDFRARWGAYSMVPFQNANHSVRVTDEFMRAVETDSSWDLKARDGTPLETVKARALWEAICKAAHVCGDPGLQFDTTINQWHTSPESGRINGSNPCSEYMFLDDTACNLASINLMQFFDVDVQDFDVVGYRHVIDVMITAMEIIVDGAAYPTPLIEKNSHAFRPLGLGYTNLGAMFMAQGLSYDSDEARSQCSGLTSILSGRAYARSAELAAEVGAFAGYEKNQDAMTNVMAMHRKVAMRRMQENPEKAMYAGHVKVPLSDFKLSQVLNAWGVQDWDRCLTLGAQHGYRNSQATVLAPTGTISFLMDADTTGIEPELSLVKTKKLVGGGSITIVNKRVVDALRRLGYNAAEIDGISNYILKTGSAVGAPGLADKHLSVFDSSFPDPVGNRYLRPEAHILMMAAAQPFVSGAISKTCNIPNDATEGLISKLYTLAWSQGLKAVALYRDGSKRTQPLQARDQKAQPGKTPTHEELMAVLEAGGTINECRTLMGLPAVEWGDATMTKRSAVIEKDLLKEVLKPHRRKLSADCMAFRHKFSIGGVHKGYIHTGVYPDGSPGEVFIKMAKEGSTVSGLMDAVGVLTSLCLQYGVPLEVLVEKFSYTSFEPSGLSANEKIRFAKSPLDYLFRFLEAEFLKPLEEPVEAVESTTTYEVVEPEKKNGNGHSRRSHGHVCARCGNPAQRTGACVTCSTCGFNEGCG